MRGAWSRRYRIIWWERNIKLRKAFFVFCSSLSWPCKVRYTLVQFNDISELIRLWLHWCTFSLISLLCHHFTSELWAYSQKSWWPFILDPLTLSRPWPWLNFHHLRYFFYSDLFLSTHWPVFLVFDCNWSLIIHWRLLFCLHSPIPRAYKLIKAFFSFIRNVKRIQGVYSQLTATLIILDDLGRKWEDRGNWSNLES